MSSFPPLVQPTNNPGVIFRALRHAIEALQLLTGQTGDKRNAAVLHGEYMSPVNPVHLPVFAVQNLPPASLHTAAVAILRDQNYRLVVSDGEVWRYVGDGTPV